MAGPGLWRWAHLAQRSWELPPETQRMMRELAARHRETVNVYVARDIYRVCIAQQESPQPLRHVVHVGDELPLWAGRLGQGAAARRQPGRCSTASPAARPTAPGHVKRLQEWIDEARPQGFAVSHGEREDGLSAVAAPILGRSGAVVAALVPQRTDACASPRARIAEFAADLRQVAQHHVRARLRPPARHDHVSAGRGCSPATIRSSHKENAHAASTARPGSGCLT